MYTEKKGDKATKAISVTKLVHYALAFTTVWTIIIAVFAAWHINQKKQTTRLLAIKEAQANFNKDLAVRFWATAHGGIYVPTNDRTPPNPHLKHIPERDITTSSGKKLTLMNPAYMLRQGRLKT